MASLKYILVFALLMMMWTHTYAAYFAHMRERQEKTIRKAPEDGQRKGRSAESDEYIAYGERKGRSAEPADAGYGITYGERKGRSAESGAGYGAQGTHDLLFPRYKLYS
ncbi:PREDICTED: uncharacterized protein LOC105448412 isoform X2 [Wasmannia auropunctata]|uniref:uncharacterized protein LOC105448412 isoform X2 n=1 Tax=Wasmannia auropunctata TaxID=64793 RepID=UPI0005EF7A30|nr:PREDICTED: uncharacterized protein LOC105448412 isoform X2 [Wasmannia auropunctata]